MKDDSLRDQIVGAFAMPLVIIGFLAWLAVVISLAAAVLLVAHKILGWALA